MKMKPEAEGEMQCRGRATPVFLLAFHETQQGIWVLCFFLLDLIYFAKYRPSLGQSHITPTGPSTVSGSNSFSSSIKSLHSSSQFRPLLVSMAGESNVQASSPLEIKVLGSVDQKLAMAKRCGHEGVVAGARAAVVATVASAVPTLASVRMLPWAKRNLNPTAQALIVSLVAGSAFFIVADKTVLATARKNSFQNLHA